jgi:LysR family transcriptional regulator, glycine cleavage system transcriptional activator
MKLSHLNALRALEATLRRGTFSAAADELGVTVAAIGQQVRGLEDYLGIRLFDRLPSGAQPLPEARAIAERLTAGFSQIEDVLTELRSGRDGRRLSLTMTYHFLDDWMSQRLPRFYALDGSVEIKIDTSDRLVDLASENVDMAIRYSQEPGAGMEALDLFSGCYFPVCSPEFAAAHRLSPDCRDLTNVPLFVLQEATTDPNWIGWREWLREFNVEKRDAIRGKRTTGRATAVTGAGLVLVGLIEAFPDLVDGRLVAPLGPWAVRPSAYRYRLIWSANRSMSRPMRVFRDWIARERDKFVREASRLLGVEIQ